MSNYDDDLGSIDILEVGEVLTPTIFALDASSSMSGSKINELNQGIREYAEDINADSALRASVDVAVVTFDGKGAHCLNPFTLAPNFIPKKVETYGGTPLGAGVNMALDMLEKRKETYRVSQGNYYRPWLIVMSDGEANDSWQAAAARIKQMEANKQVICQPLGIGAQADFNMLRQLSSENQAQGLDVTMLKDFFKLLSRSQRAVIESARSGQQAATVPAVNDQGTPIFTAPVDIS